jgi:hypothetical protein
LGDDGFGGIDDTDDVIGESGFPLCTAAPPSDSALTAAASARMASVANTAALAVRLALPRAALASEDLTLVMPTATGTGIISSEALGSAASAAALTAAESGPRGHVLVCGTADAMGYLLRAVANLASASSAHTIKGSSSSSSGSEGGGSLASEIVVLAASKPSEAAINAMHSGSSALLAKVTFLTGSASDPVDLLKAGIMSARAALVLTLNKPAASADGSDNLSDDTEAIMATAVIHKLNPRLHCVTELLHGSHAPFIRPTGNNLNDAQRSSFAYILEEREAMKQKAKVRVCLWL